jgi:hypothetical protein
MHEHIRYELLFFCFVFLCGAYAYKLHGGALSWFALSFVCMGAVWGGCKLLGQLAFRSDQSATYYHCLMNSSEPLPDKLSAGHCTEKLKALVDTVRELRGLAKVPSPPRKLLSLKDTPAPPIPIMDDMEVDGDVMPDPPLDSEVGDLAVALSEPEEIDGDDLPEEGVPEFILGVKASVEQHTSRDRGLRVTCPCHSNCKAFRSLRQDIDVFGLRAAEFFLETWLSHADMGDAHNGFRPTRRDIRTYLANKVQD